MSRESAQRPRKFLCAPTARRALLGALALAFALFAFPTPARAQVPGYPQLNPGAVKAEYLAEVIERINEVLAEWGGSWAGDRLDDLVALYTEDAILIPPGDVMVRGQTAIRDYLAEVLPEHGHIEAFMIDFDASGEMAQVFGNYVLGIQLGDDAGTQWSGPMMTVYVRRGRRWKIRSQVFMPGQSTN